MSPSTLTERLTARRPILTVIVCSLSSYAVLVFVHRSALVGSNPRDYWTTSVLVAFLAGITYTHFFEYAYHRLLMHGGAWGPGFIKKNHLEHHRVFYGDNFTSRSRDDWQYISSPWYVFPGLLTIHYLALRGFVRTETLLAFFGGVLLHYLVFECTHWLTHVRDNAVDRWIGGVPALGRLRRYHIRHHRHHHEIPTVDFNFNPPFLGDVVFRTLDVPAEGQGPYSR